MADESGRGAPGKRRRPHHPVFARLYARMSPQIDAGGMRERRRELLAGLTGDVVEVGAGNGLNFAHYPSSVTRVVAVEPEGYLRAIAARAAAAAPVPVEVVDGVAEAVPLGAASMDAAVVSLVLCSVERPAAVLAELRRVLRPAAELRFLEHVIADSRGLVWAQKVVDATFWPVLMGRCHTARDSVRAIETAGFRVEALERFRFPEGGVATPASPFVRGVAVAP